MCAYSEKVAEMNAEGTNVCACFTAHPEYTQVTVVVELVELALVDGSDTQLPFHGGNQRWPLEKRTGECLQGSRKLRLTTRQSVVKANHTHVFLSGALLGFDESCGTINANDQAPSDLWVESTTVSSLFNPI